MVQRVLERCAREKLHHHFLPLRVTPAAQVTQRTGKSALSSMAKVNVVLGAHQNTLSWPRVPHFVLCSQITCFTCCWLLSCSVGHLSSFSDTDTLSQSGQKGTWVSCESTHYTCRGVWVCRGPKYAFFGFSGLTLGTQHNICISIWEMGRKSGQTYGSHCFYISSIDG